MRLDPLSTFTGISKEELQKRMKRLTTKERAYFKYMLPRYGMLYVKGEPGIAKSAIFKSIANKLGFNFIEIRLAMIDETDVGLFPKVSKLTLNGIEWDVLAHVAPEWAFLANDAPTIVFFDELNRATLPVRNAALQLFLERGIGHKFKFNDNVLMAAAGNLGEEDGTEVEEMDSALNNRLILVKHELTFKEWCDGYATENVHPAIIEYIEHHTGDMYRKPGNDNTKNGARIDSYATPRSWSMLSDYINTNYPPMLDIVKTKHGELTVYRNNEGNLAYKKQDGTFIDSKFNPMSDVETYAFYPRYIFSEVKDWLADIQVAALSYIGVTATGFIKYLADTIRLSIDHILDDYPKHKASLMKYNRDKFSELISALRKKDLLALPDNKIDNVKDFLIDMKHEDELTGYLLYVLDELYDTNQDESASRTKKLSSFIKDPRFKKYWQTVKDHCQRQEDELRGGGSTPSK